MKIEQNVALAARTTIGVGGAAAHYARVESEAALREALAWATARGLKVRVLGGGSNVVIADAGFAGLVIEMAIRGILIDDQSDTVVVRAAAGEPWDAFVAELVSRNYQGLECLSGIPGRVGATPIQNVGAYGQDVSETITSVIAVDTADGSTRVFTNEQCQFAYRDSFFKSTEPGRFIVTEVTFRLTPGKAPSLRYGELASELTGPGKPTPSLTDTRNAVLQLRRSKSMVVDENDPNSRSCGSFFLNPVLERGEQLSAFFARAPATDIPTFPQPDGRVKLSAGWLIEFSGLARGLRDGAVGLSTKHALAIVAYEGARAEDVARLARRAQSAVMKRFGVALHTEPVFWGFDD
ncbi:MAG TPA: UDP-N-acetylmuramate dehydrogenase [Polyangiaceae bacterium]